MSKNIVTQVGQEVVIGTHRVLLTSVTYSEEKLQDEKGRSDNLPNIQLEGIIIGETNDDSADHVRTATVHPATT